jgi:exopolysaccharide production protein ExoZ
MSSSPVSLKLEGIQVARAAACMAVVVFHSYSLVRGFPAESAWSIPAIQHYGFFGVNFFFAISGFIICHVTREPGRWNLREFFLRRFLRIFPLYALFTLVAYLWLFQGHGVKTSSSDYSTLSLLKSLAAYPQESEPILAVGWSLEHEIIFYLIAAPVVLLATQWGLLLAILALGFLGYHAFPGFYGHVFSTLHFDFAAGILVYQLFRRGVSLGFVVPFCCGIAGYFLSTRNVAFAASIGGACALLGFANFPVNRATGFMLRPLVFLGDISYSLYLGHWLVFRLIEIWLGDHRLPGWAAEWVRWGGIATAIGLAYVTWRFIEQPLARIHSAAARRPVADGGRSV